MERRSTIKKQASECSPERPISARDRPYKPRGLLNRAPTLPSSTLSPSPPEKAAVLYYISRNRKLEHPHFLEVPLSSSGELLLRDVMERLDVLRGKGMASMYSWSSKRSYKNGYVWHDLSEDDVIVPINGNEYVLKGSELFNDSDSGNLLQTPIFPFKNTLTADSPINKPQITKLQQHKPSTSSVDYSSSSSSINGRDSKATQENTISDNVTNSATQTEEQQSTSTDTLENLIRSNINKMDSFRVFEEDEVPIPTKARIKATNLIMQLISCGSIPIRNRPTFGIIPTYKPRFSQSKFPSPFSSSSVSEFECFSEIRRFPHLTERCKPMESTCSHVKCIPRNSPYKLEGRRNSAKNSDSFREETVIKIEESLLPELGL